jgi:hypothetical protein
MLRSHCVCFLALLAAASGCGSSVAISATGTGAAGGAPADVTGTVIYTYVGDVTETVLPITGATVQIQVPDGGAWKSFMTATDAAGAFTVPGVPQGPFVVTVEGELVYTSARVLDLGAEIGGRPSEVYTTLSPTLLVNDIQGLDAWNTDADTVEWFSPNSDGESYLFYMALPPDGATSLTGQTTDWYPNALLDGSVGDTLYVTQLSAQPGPSGTSISTVVRATSFQGIEQVDGMQTTLSGAFAPVTADQGITFDIDAAALAAQVSAVNPNAQDMGAEISVTTVPGALKYGLIGYSADVLDASLPPGGGADVAVDDLVFGNPYPAAWGLMATASEYATVSFTAPGATMPLAQYAGIYVIAPAATLANGPFAKGPITPKVGPVEDPRVNGATAFAPAEGATTTPTLSWSPPKLGAPSGYYVVIYALTSTDGITTATYTATLTTTEQTFPIPPGILTSGTPYFFQISAIDTPIDMASHPFRSAPEYASADVITDVIQP